ncbi:phage terminase small subunit P27 family [Pseudorhodoferax sp. Leaf274]|uniref:phage terminase small subunit P27 family n=1 Tax=Pseudorhodoferax sp. Leaf274 TaxID=1736318 RepID=UPI000702BD84|nr:phage terminase small subunit P27 family [Pseudorhodoferax sp. Leaf274]KQP43923.1 terminase [Pseudorhodoferax sp. Leaf274]
MAGAAGRSGRRPKPVAQKQLAGNPGKRALNTSAPDFGQVTNIDCPDWMGEFGRALWEHVVPMLCGQKVLSAADVQNIEVYCDAYDRFRLAREEVRTKGVTVLGAQGGVVKNPAATVVKESVAVMATYGGMLGLDPSSRQRLTGKTKDPGQANPFGALLNG